MLEKILLGFLFGMVLANVIISLIAPSWEIRESPKTGLCYEVKISTHAFGHSRSISQIDSKFCEEK